MSIRYSLSQRTPAQNGLFAALACAITLTLTAGPALAQDSALQRVEISGRVVEAPTRFDVHANCRNIGPQLEESLQTTWARQRSSGRVRVQLLMENGQITAVQARGISSPVARAVRDAVQELNCGPQLQAGAQLYRFAVDFIDPDTMEYRERQALMAGGAQSGVSIALASD